MSYDLDGKASLPPEVFRQVDRICEQFEQAWRQRQRPEIEPFLASIEQSLHAPLLRELLLLDVEYRRNAGDKPTAADYLDRFSQHAALVESLFTSPPTLSYAHLSAETVTYVPKERVRIPAAGKHDQKAAHRVLSLDEFIHSLTECGLMEQSEVQAFLTALPSDKRPQDGRQLAQELYRQKKLTKFQVQAVYQQKTRGLVVGNYVVLDKIGKGGMGQVYKAQHRKMKRVVALKVLPSSATRSEEAVKRFQREVEAAAKLCHPNIVTAYDADEAKSVHFLVMEYVEGKDLAAMVKEKGPFAVPVAVDYILQAAHGLDYAHRHGVIHRDIKPANLLYQSGGTIKILDMGLARIEDQVPQAEPESDLTQTGQVMGTLDYMAPEQALDTKTADARADIYSLGCTLHALVTGRPPYRGNTLAQRLLAHRNDPIPSLREKRSEIPESLDAVFRKMLAKGPDERQQSMAEVIADLERCRPELEYEPRQPGSYDETISFHRGQLDRFAVHPDTGELDLSDPLDVEQSVELTERLVVPPIQTAVFRIPRWNRVATHSALIAFGLLLCAAVAMMLRTSKGTLVVEVNERGAKVVVLDAAGVVEVEGTSVGEKLQFSIEPGKHQVRVEKAGFEIFADEFALQPRATRTVSARLEPATPKSTMLVVQLGERDALVEMLDETNKVLATYRSTGSPLSIPVAPGKRRLHVQKAGFRDFVQEYTFSEGATQTVSVELQKEESAAPESSKAGLTAPAAQTVHSTGVDDQRVESCGTSPEPLEAATVSPNLASPSNVPSRSPAPAIAPFDAATARRHQEAWSKHQAAPLLFENSIGMKFAFIPPGEFDMGVTEEEFVQLQAEATDKGFSYWQLSILPSEGPKHRVKITQPFYLGLYEVTQAEYERVMGSNPSAFSAQGSKAKEVSRRNTSRHPVEMVSWDDANAFCQALSALPAEQASGSTYRLPTEAEWEYACRAGTTGKWVCGDDESSLMQYCWRGKVTRIVGELRPNGFGIFDMHGNVFEWCQDWWDPAYYKLSPFEDPMGPLDRPTNLWFRVNRGGSFITSAYTCRSAYRCRASPSQLSDRFGFRVVSVTVDASGR